MKKIFAAIAVAFCLTVLGPATVQADVVMSWNFNTDGDFEGWTANNVSGLAVAGGFLTGEASSNDPQLNNTGLNLTIDSGTQTWSTLAFTVEETDETPANVSFDPVGIVVAINGGGMGGLLVTSGFQASDLGNGQWRVVADISAFDANSAITSLRVDPIGGAASNSNSQTDGNTFAVDSIVLSAVPEPSSLLLLSLTGLACLTPRRRKQS